MYAHQHFSAILARQAYSRLAPRPVSAYRRHQSVSAEISFKARSHGACALGGISSDMAARAISRCRETPPPRRRAPRRVNISMPSRRGRRQMMRHGGWRRWASSTTASRSGDRRGLLAYFYWASGRRSAHCSPRRRHGFELEPSRLAGRRAD